MRDCEKKEGRKKKVKKGKTRGRCSGSAMRKLVPGTWAPASLPLVVYMVVTNRQTRKILPLYSPLLAPSSRPFRFLFFTGLYSNFSLSRRFTRFTPSSHKDLGRPRAHTSSRMLYVCYELGSLWCPPLRDSPGPVPSIRLHPRPSSRIYREKIAIHDISIFSEYTPEDSR